MSHSDFSLDAPIILDVLLLSSITFSVWLMNQWREPLCLHLSNWYICATQIFSAIGLVNIDFPLIIFVGTLLTSCRYIGRKISPTSPIFKFLTTPLDERQIKEILRVYFKLIVKPNLGLFVFRPDIQLKSWVYKKLFLDEHRWIEEQKKSRIWISGWLKILCSVWQMA